MMKVLSAWLKVFSRILVKPMPSTFRQLNEMTVLTPVGTLVWWSVATLSLYGLEVLLAQRTAPRDLSPIWLGLSGLSCILFCVAYGLAYLRQKYWHRRPVPATPLAVALGAIYVISVGLCTVLTVIDVFLVSMVIELHNEFILLEGSYYLVLTSIAICTLLRLRLEQKLATLYYTYVVAWLSVLGQIFVRPLPSTFRQLNRATTLTPFGAVLWSSITTLGLYGLEALLILTTEEPVDVTLLWLSLSGLSWVLFCGVYTLARLRQRFWNHRNLPGGRLVVTLGAIYILSIGLSSVLMVIGLFLIPSLHGTFIILGYGYHIVLTSIAMHTLLGLRVVPGHMLRKLGHTCMPTLYAWLRLFRGILLQPTPSTFQQMRNTAALTFPSAMLFQFAIILASYFLDVVHGRSIKLLTLLSSIASISFAVLLVAYSITLVQRALFRRTTISYRELVLGFVAVQAVGLFLKSCLTVLGAVLPLSLDSYIPLTITVYHYAMVGIVVYAITGLQVWQSLVASFVGVLTGKAFFTMIVFLQSTPR